MNQLSKNKKRKYKVFGLNIISDFVLDELLPGEETAEIEIIRGKVPDEISNWREKNELFQASGNEFLFNIQGVAKYFVSQGNVIIVEPYAEASYSSVKLYLLGTAFGALLLLRGALPIHGSAAVIDGHCVIITGISGAGKSTLSLALRDKGYSFLTDDVAVLQIKDGDVWVQPGYPQQKIWRDSADTIGVNVNSLAHVSLVRENKFFLPAHDGFQEVPVTLAVVCELIPAESDVVSIKKLEGSQKLSVLMNHTYRVELLHHFGLELKHFQQCAAVAHNISVFQMIRPVNKFTIEKQIELIKEMVKTAAINIKVN